MVIEDGRYQSSVSQLNFKLPVLDNSSYIGVNVVTIDGLKYLKLNHVGDGLFKNDPSADFQLSIQVINDPDKPDAYPASIAVIPEATFTKITARVVALYHQGHKLYP